MSPDLSPMRQPPNPVWGFGSLKAESEIKNAEKSVKSPASVSNGANTASLSPPESQNVSKTAEDAVVKEGTNSKGIASSTQQVVFMKARIQNADGAEAAPAIRLPAMTQHRRYVQYMGPSDSHRS